MYNIRANRQAQGTGHGPPGEGSPLSKEPQREEQPSPPDPSAPGELPSETKERSSGFSEACTQILSDCQPHSESQAAEQHLPALCRRIPTEPNCPGESLGLGAAGSGINQGVKVSEGELWPRLQETPLHISQSVVLNSKLWVVEYAMLLITRGHAVTQTR